MTLQVKVHKTQLANEQTNEQTIGRYFGMLVFLDCHSINSSSFSFLLLCLENTKFSSLSVSGNINIPIPVYVYALLQHP